MIWVVVAGLALVQSLFGVGLLLIGTPILLLLAVPFRDTLWILLPASLTVSSLQLLLDRQIDRGFVGSVFGFAIPALVVGLVLALRIPVQVNLTPAVAALLALAATLRLSGPLAARVREVASRHERVILALIGFVHGLTNMGGSLLLDFAASKHTDKTALRQQVALGYVVFASSQLIVLSVVGGPRFGMQTLGYGLVAGSVFVLVGRRGFRAVSQPVFSAGLSVFMLGVAALLVWRSL